MRKILRGIDSISGLIGGGFVKWLIYILILIIIYDVIARYVFRAPTIWGYDTSLMIGATIYGLAWCYTQRYHGHVRVDVVYTHISPRKKAIVDAVGTFLVHLPLVGLLTYEASKWAIRAWVIEERMVETYWYPPAAPVRTAIALAFVLLFLQLIAELVRQGYFALKGASYD